MAKGQILIVDDEPQILKLLQFLLEDEGYKVCAVSTGEEAIKTAETNSFDLAILDITLPGIDGYTTCHCLQERGLKILFLSSHSEGESVVRGLEMGALDYIRKPFNTRELILRVEILLRSSGVNENTKTELKSGRIHIDLGQEKLLLDGKDTHLSPTEYQLLTLLMAKQSMVVGFDEILTTVWGDPNWGGGKQMIKVHIKRLREKIEIDPHEPKIILNHWGRGYLFAPEVVRE
jgi:DNA-binding response OmpR family regulator